MTTSVRVRPCLPNNDAPPPVGAVPDGVLVYAIGDIHGRLDLLDALHSAIVKDASQRAAVSRRVIVYLGDYVSRGPDSRKVLDRLIAGPPEGFSAVYLRGNHEDILTRTLDGERRWGAHWLIYGGVQGMADYGVEVNQTELDANSLIDLMDQLRANFPDNQRQFLDRLKIEHWEGDYCFVHAGLRPGVPLRLQSVEDRIWIRDEFLDADDDFGGIVVHGHCIFDGPQVRHNRIGIDTGAVRSGVLTALGLMGREQWFLQTYPETAEHLL